MLSSALILFNFLFVRLLIAFYFDFCVFIVFYYLGHIPNIQNCAAKFPKLIKTHLVPYMNLMLFSFLSLFFLFFVFCLCSLLSRLDGMFVSLPFALLSFVFILCSFVFILLSILSQLFCFFISIAKFAKHSNIRKYNCHNGTDFFMLLHFL